MEIGRGTISTIMGRGNNNADIIPVDIVCNTLITAAWANSFMRSSNTIAVYNCTSGPINPVTYSELMEKTLKYSRKNPSKYIAMYPSCGYRTSRFVHTLYEIFLQFIPALLFDLLLRAKGKKPIMFKIAKRFKMAYDTGEYFVLNGWKFEARNFERMIRAAKETQADCNEFNCDLRTLNWDEYVECHLLGIRKFILKDDLSSLPMARNKLRKIFWVRRIFQLILVVAAIYVIFIILRN